MWAHDLILQSIYESMDLDQRQELHLNLGTYLGVAASNDTSLSLARGMATLQLNERQFYSGKSISSPLIAIACEQINQAGKHVVDSNQKLKFAEWNLLAGQKSSRRSNFSAAFHYFSNGITFLDGEESWSIDYRLSLEL